MVLNDEQWMEKALDLARLGEGKTSPNPMVGAVLVKDDTLVGSGWHKAAGEPHAEIVAMEAAGSRSQGATLYLNLEPCVHYGKTPPCADAVAAAGVARVVIAMQDPDPRMKGRGIETLRRAGLRVEVGVLGARAERSNEAYLLHRTQDRPFVTYKAAVTLDGKTAAFDGNSKWISGEAARQEVQRLRSMSDAICVGAGTVIADDPSLTVRGVSPEGKQPLRVIVDSSARIPTTARLFSTRAPLVVAVSRRAAESSLNRPRAAGAEILETDSEGQTNLVDLLRQLGERGVTSLLLEGGPTLAGAFQAAGLIDRYIFYVAPKLLGGANPAGLFEGLLPRSIIAPQELVFEQVKKVGDDIRIDAVPIARATEKIGAERSEGLDLPALTNI